jgi:hypothetical protein
MARSRVRVRLEDGLKLDLNRLFRDGVAKRGEVRRGVIRWHRGSSGDIIAGCTIETDVRTEPLGWMTLNFGKVEQRIRLEAVWRNFGGMQWYFLCPDGGGDASVLWWPPGATRFMSRKALGRRVAYGCQFETPRDRALSQAQNIRCRLGGKEYISLAMPDPPKPKGMHRCTYERQLRRCETKSNTYYSALAERLRARQKKG